MADGTLPGGGGEGGKDEDNIKSNREEQYAVVESNSLLVAGRVGIVDDVELKEIQETVGGGQFVIAEIYVTVPICRQMSIKVAVWNPTFLKPKDNEPEPVVTGLEANWDQVRELLKRRQVRFLAGELAEWLPMITKHLRDKYMVNLAAWAPYEDPSGELMCTSSFMLVLGPVRQLKINTATKKRATRGDGDGDPPKDIKAKTLDLEDLAPQAPRRLTRGDGDDWTRRWPAMQEVKQKAPSPSWGVRKL